MSMERGLVLKSCIECGLPAVGRRCPVHERERQRKHDARRPSATRRGYDAEWQRQSTRAVAEHVARYGYFCPGWGRPAHYSTDLTADHVRPLARGGGPDEIQVMCRSCNGRKGARMTRPVED